MAELVAVEDVASAIRDANAWDAVVLVAPRMQEDAPDAIAAVVSAVARVDDAVNEKTQLIAAADLAGGRLVLAPTGVLSRDHDDVRRFADAAAAGIERARAAGAKRPLLIACGAPSESDFEHAPSVSALGALQAMWQPLEAREAYGPEKIEPVDRLGVASVSPEQLSWLGAAETGRRLARDLAGTEPERMAPPRFAEHCVQAFRETGVTVEVVADPATIEREYPLIAAVGRASFAVERHHPRVVRLEYVGEGPIEHTLLLAGKGVTYDTGGADIKAGGAMAGMSRDKGGAAAVAGFVRAVAKLSPRGLRVVAKLGAVRNSVGADCYVTDEIITSHAGVRVRIGNTDAEGRLVLADLLSHLRERATTSEGPRLFSLATLTGHAVRAVGPYSIAIDNRAARLHQTAEGLSRAGDAWGDPFEISRLRREDWDFVKPRSKADDVLSCNNAPSSGTNRGHQFPMAFLAVASGLDHHSQRRSDEPLPYTHIDIAGSATEGGDWQHGRPTGAPIIAMLRALV